jgi:hypothetical protein
MINEVNQYPETEQNSVGLSEKPHKVESYRRNYEKDVRSNIYLVYKLSTNYFYANTE